MWFPWNMDTSNKRKKDRISLRVGLHERELTEDGYTVQIVYFEGDTTAEHLSCEDVRPESWQAEGKLADVLTSYPKLVRERNALLVKNSLLTGMLRGIFSNPRNLHAYKVIFNLMGGGTVSKK